MNSRMLKPRRKEFKNTKKPILIVCEDSKSSVLYFEAKSKALRLNPVVEVDGKSGSSPISVVDYAIERRKQQKKKAKNEGIEEFEKVYCVIDVDDHPTIREAIIKANNNRLIPIVSNQCFELWYLLHFMSYSTAYLHRTDIYKKLKEYLGRDYNKGDDKIYEQIKQYEATAIETAKKLEKSAKEDSNERNPLRNSTTEVYILIEDLNAR